MQFRILWPIAGVLPALIKIHFLAGNQNGNDFSGIIPLERVYDEGRILTSPLEWEMFFASFSISIF
jgi:hypothetical protein